MKHNKCMLDANCNNWHHLAFWYFLKLSTPLYCKTGVCNGRGLVDHADSIGKCGKHCDNSYDLANS